MSAIYALPGNEDFADRLASHSGLPRRVVQVHRFPDGESRVRIEPPTPRSVVVIVCTLDHPDSKLLPLVMAAATARELGAWRVGLVAPYLAYMRQDTRFHEGEAVSARVFGQLLGGAFNWLVTVDPHLHRYRRLDDIYPLEGYVVHAAGRLAEWIARHVPRPLLIGPDGESAQWVSAVARMLGAPCVVAAKQRSGDRDVQITLPALDAWADCTPVVLDDIIASGRTMIATVQCLRERQLPAPVCVAVHGIFADDAVQALHAAGAARVVTSNTIASPQAQIDLSAELARVVLERCGGPPCRPAPACAAPADPTP
ncbi:ribose-phosphate pyrophosphokinase [Dyella sp.]|jgi:ribose-phosphate pyrophosphokinase|uniref:ribose-phosphate pyrophosphokinase n=1 Tax=Dyella sp. TaxID=1869338 RepID=UPI002D791187|nr:ribose-phosphate pyrophosphokinase [Dyella sp.]HET6433066.1 ribose-phosphate pyrophosphokinase [Dyella sp.]